MPAIQTPRSVAFRSSTQVDCSHLVLLADMATRRLTSFLWGQASAPGQSAFEVGRNILRDDENHLMHFKNWRVAEHKGQIVGALNTYVMPEQTGAAAAPLAVVKPLNDLKAIAAGTWYISVAAIYPEHQGKGFGKSLLTEAESHARAAHNDRMVLIVGSFNQRAHSLYQQTGFKEWARRPLIPFPGSDEAGDWILMVKDLSRHF